MRHLRRAALFVVGLPKEVVTGLLLVAALAAATGILISSPHHVPAKKSATGARAEAGGGGAFVPAPSTTASTVAPTTTSPPTTQPSPPPTQASRVVTTSPPTTAPPPPPPPAHSLPSAAVGVYSGAANPAGAAGFAAATGAHVSVVEDYLPGGSWSQIDGSGGSLGWLLGPWQGTGYQLVLGVPMFDNSGSDSLAQGATGAYNQYFVTLAQTLISSGQGNAILRLGQEFTGSWNQWRVTDTTDAANYAAYYRQIVTAMRSVAGQAFRFIWEGADPEDGSYSGAYTADDSYPGDGYVDYIGTDTYDQSWVGSCGLPFNNTSTPAESQCSWANTLPGLTRVADFAGAHGKPVVFPEWGLAIRGDGHGLGDDPEFIQEMGSWISTHSVAFDIYFNDDDDSGQVDTMTDGRFPASLAAYRATFG